MCTMLLDELRDAIYRAQNNTHLRYATSPKMRVSAPCPHCNDVALANTPMSIVQVDLPSIFLMVDMETYDSMRHFGWIDNPNSNGIRAYRFMGHPVILAPYTQGWKVCRGA